ncbi:MAG: hypothetical protein ACK4XJ_05110 [Fimbriimonadaceae bacterium]
MATPETPTKKGLWAKLTGNQRLYLLLIAVTSLPFIFQVAIPTKCNPQTVSLYQALMTIPEGSTVLIQSDWTNSTRGESQGQLEALLRILMRRNIKFVVYSVADPQAPLVARNVIRSVNQERKANGEREYERWNDWVNLGYFPNAEGTGQAMAANIRVAFAGRTDLSPNGVQTDVFQSPVLKDIRSVGDAAMLINVHASGTQNVLIERLYGRIRLASMCTGVMGPEVLVYYASGQLVGVSVGLRGVVEMETMMQNGVNVRGADGRIAVDQPGRPETPGFEGKKNFGRGMQYFLSLHTALLLLIGAVVVGNIPVVKQNIANRRRRR